jgi:hypothetical protein
MQIFPAEKNLPLLFKSSVGSLGKISIFIKSKELIDQELKTYDSDESESEYDD